MKFKIFIFILIQGHSMSSYSSGYRNKRQISIGFGIPGLDNQQIGGAINSFLGGLLGQNQQQSQPNQANPQGHGGQSFNQFGGPPGGHHHGGFNQGGFNQGGFNPGGFNQGGFNQGGCNVNNGGCEQGCRVSRRGRTKCYCNPGFFLLNDRRSCGDIDECSNEFNQPLCQELCTNTIGSYLCGCSDGRTLRPDGSCIITGTGESCAVNNGGCHQFCRDRRRRGGVRCRCSEGYELGPDGKSCLDLDECTLGFHDCGPIPCVNTEGGYDCGAPAPNGPVPTAPVPVPTAPVPVPTAPAPVPTAPVPVPTAPAPVPTAPAHRGCGMNSKKSLFTRIVGGKPADPKDWPWMAALLRGGAQNQQFCGGTLINDRHVLTAAHCINSVTASDITVRLGEYSFDTPNENSPTDFKVAGIVKHSGYDTQTQENDIAIIKLDRPTASTEFIRPACLPPPNNNFNGQLGYVTGWGTIFFGGPVSNTLQEVVIPVWNQVDCVAAYPNNKVADSMMCCGQKIGGKDSCQGDSGGPFLVQIFPDNRWYVAGIVSWGIECASPNKPGVYTRVNHYLDWIASNSV